jgi:hypothetical protein
MPDVVGLPARDAVRELMTLGLTPRLTGTGFVVSQHPVAGSPLTAAATAQLELRRLVASNGNQP